MYSEVPANSTRELIIVVASQKGLCGGYNTNIFKKTTEYIRDDNDTPYTREYDYISIGKELETLYFVQVRISLQIFLMR